MQQTRLQLASKQLLRRFFTIVLLLLRQMNACAIVWQERANVGPYTVSTVVTEPTPSYVTIEPPTLDSSVTCPYPDEIPLAELCASDNNIISLSKQPDQTINVSFDLSTAQDS